MSAQVSANEALLGYFKLLRKSGPSQRMLRQIEQREASVRRQMEKPAASGGSTRVQKKPQSRGPVSSRRRVK